MILAGGQGADFSVRPEVTLTLNHFDPFGQSPRKTSPLQNLRFLDKTLKLSYEQRETSTIFTPPTADITYPYGSTSEAGFSRRRPRHVPINIIPYANGSIRKGLPPSPPSSIECGSGPSFRYTYDFEKEDKHEVCSKPDRRQRHIPIVIPEVAHPQNLYPPTPSHSAERLHKSQVPFQIPPKPSSIVESIHKSRVSFKIQSTPLSCAETLHDLVSLRTPDSCESQITRMSRPTTSGSRTSTLDSDASGPSQNQMYGSNFQPSSSSYLADMNSSSESSLSQAVQNVQVKVDSSSKLPKSGEPAPPSATGSPALGAQAPGNANGTTNLSGLVCNVHKCTGKEPHALVGATTTILGNKLYVFAGRILSRKRPHLTSDIYELDLIRRHWTKVEMMGHIPSPRYFHSVCALGDTKLICYGGMSPTDYSTNQAAPQEGEDPTGQMAVMSDIHVYDAPTRTWTYIATADTPPGRYAHCAAVLPSSAVFTSSNAPLSAIQHNPPSANPNQGTLGIALDGTGGAEMIVVGGQDSNNKYIDAISVFNLRSLKWTHTHTLPRSCGAYRSVVTPLTSLAASKIGAGSDHTDPEESNSDKPEPTTSMLIYSNYNFLDVKLELQVLLPDGSLIEKSMNSQVSPPGLRFPNGDVLDNHFVVSGTYLTSSKHEYALWALDLRTLAWSRIDAGGGIFSQGSWNRGVLWSRRNTFVILGNRKRTLVNDYNHRRINFSNVCMVELEAFGLYDNPRRAWPTSDYPSVSAPEISPAITPRNPTPGGRPIFQAAVELGTMAMSLRELADMDLLAIGGERIPVNSYLLARRWGPFFVKLIRESGTSNPIVQNDASSSSDGGTLRPGHLNPSSVASRNSSITITPSVNTSNYAPSTVTAMSNNSGSTVTGGTSLEAPTPNNLPASSRPRQLYLPHTLLTLRALVYYLYTSALPAPDHQLCTPQILCSLLQLARPYRVDGLLEATVERLHQMLDGRNAAAVFNAAAMAAGGGRGTGAAFGKEGELDLVEGLQAGLTITKLQSRNLKSQQELDSSGDETGSDFSSSIESASASEESEVAAGQRKGSKVAMGADEIWSGGVSCVVGLQKRGLRGLMEGRRMRERERGKTVGGLGSSATGTAPSNGTGVGLGIA